MTFEAGKSGNPGGRPKVKPWRDALMMALKEAGEDMPKLREIAKKTVELAMGGDRDARREIAERLDGKVPQTVGGDDANPIRHIHKIERIIVDSEDSDREGI